MLRDARVLEAGAARRSGGAPPARSRARVGLLAHRLVVVAGVVEDDERRRPGAHSDGELRDDLGAGCGAWCSTRDAKTASAPAPRRVAGLAARRARPATSVTLRKPRARDALARARELRVRAVDGDDALEDRREHLEQPPVARARVDRERAPRQERRERGEVRAHLGGQARRRCASRPAARRTRAPPASRARSDLGDARQAAVAVAERSTARERVGHDRVARGVVRQAHERARPLAADRDEPGLPQRRRVARDVRLALAEQLGELADASSSSAASASRRSRTGSESTR